MLRAQQHAECAHQEWLPGDPAPVRYIDIAPGMLHAELEQHPERSWDLSAQDDTGEQVWDASIALAQWFAREGSWLVPSQSSALELGAGVGLVSIALAKLGVPRVLATDANPQALELCQKNAARNAVGDSIHVFQYRWGEAIDRLLLEERACPPVLVMADVLYWSDEGYTADSLEQAVRQLVAAGGCKYIVHACKSRDPARQAAFAESLEDLGRWQTEMRGSDVTIAVMGLSGAGKGHALGCRLL